MLEKIFIGSRKYWALVGILLLVILTGVITYAYQFTHGLTVTGLSRDVPWGFYIAQFTFLVGVAASGVMVVLPYYLHDYKAFGKMTVLGEFLAIAAVLMCMLFIFVDMGQPMRVLNIPLYPTLNSPMFWDMVVLFGYLFLNALIARVVFGSERKGVAPPKWVKPVIILSIPWAISIHTVTAFLYAGLEGRSFWLTAILAPRFLASAFAAGPALLILLCLLVRRHTKFDVGDKALHSLSTIVAYAMVANVFFIAVELFTALYSDIPSHVSHLQFLYLGYEGNNALVPWMWTSTVLAAVALVLMLVPSYRRSQIGLLAGCVAVIASIWIDKGLGMVVAGFIPTPLEKSAHYWPTTPEVLIGLGVYAVGFLVLTFLFKIAISVREEWIREKPA